jgi:hypothetical protein
LGVISTAPCRCGQNQRTVGAADDAWCDDLRRQPDAHTFIEGAGHRLSDESLTVSENAQVLAAGLPHVR